jgi:type I restriction enzyme S subunit
LSFPAYPEYKASGVEWLGQVPEHWEVRPLRRLIEGSVINGLFKKKDQFGSGTRLLNVFDVYQRDFYVDFEQLERVICTAEEQAAFAVRRGDLFFVRSSLKQEGIAVVCVAGPCDEPSVFECHLVRARPLPNHVGGRYASYVLNSPVHRAILIANAKVTTMTTIDQEAILSTPIPVAPLPEQLAIASFLDRETAKIDSLVAEQQRLIELLKEKRQAVISHAVTKGLEPNVRMKDSGIEWLGNVPEHWEVKPLKYLARFASGGTPSKTVIQYWNGDVPWASSKDLKSETLADTIDHTTQFALADDAASLVPTGSILVVVRGMILLHTFPVVQTERPMAINQDLKAITAINGVSQAYLPWLLRGTTTATFQRIDEAAHGTKVLRMEAWTSIELPVPPPDEQRAIVAFVMQQRSVLECLIAEAQHAIDLLQERRTALISAAVTGKIDVRNFAVKEAVA